MLIADLKNFTGKFQSIGLDVLNKNELLDRFDTKFVFSELKIFQLFKNLETLYCILEIENHRAFVYRTIYYDSDQFLFYHQHHNGKSNRDKIRTRLYNESNLCFLEIKFKTNKNKTIKSRKKIPDNGPLLSDESLLYLKENLPDFEVLIIMGAGDIYNLAKVDNFRGR